ncbi:EAL domain-containing protein [Janthinobacterium sp. 17J80-10]|uniref:bifunctional diguanylate cyclase/phosphodiesterase n=1 Tax=Janthinobacterium sp. 17J80-10 TaxID=2497863 RepID=UPI0013E8A086|nr:EAL domain-containing protein [Janthinobacterium sp. 17J80-10]
MTQPFGPKSLKLRMLVVVLIVIVAAIWGFAVRMSAVLQADLEKILIAQMSATADFVTADLDSELQLRTDLLSQAAAAITPAMLADPAKIQRLFEQRDLPPKLFPNGLLVADKNGTIIADYPQHPGRVGTYIGDREHFRASMATNKPYVGTPVISRFSRQPIIPFAMQLQDASGAAAGVLTAGISPFDPNLFKFRENLNLGMIVRVVVMSAKANMIVFADNQKRIMQQLPPKGVNPLLDRRLRERIEVPGINMVSNGVEALNVNRFMKTTDWMVITGVATKTAFAPIKTLQREIYLTALLMTLAIAALLHIIFTRHLRPLEDAAKAIGRMAEHGNALTPLPVARDDETGRLVSSFNRLVVERNRLHAALQESERTLQKAQSVANIGSWTVEIADLKVTWSEQTYKIFGIPPGTPLSRDIVLNCVLPEDRELVRNAWQTALQGTPFDVEHRFETAEGMRWAHQRAEMTFGDAGQVQMAIGTVQDITDSKVSEAYIEFLAYHDALTKLPNRLLAKDRLEQAMAYSDRAHAKAALLFIDLDSFKSVNDSLGHLIGDALLKAVATRLRESVRETETISRQGGDEFLIVLSDMRDNEAIAKVAEKVLDNMARVFNIDGLELFATLSMGVAVYPDDGRDFNTLLKKADTAMYHAKEAGRDTYRFYAEQMNAEASAHLNMRNGLRLALERGEFVLHYQPQISLASGQVVGVEALIRWNHPELGMLPAGSFIPTAEDCGLIIPIGDWVLHEACRQAVAWQRAGLPQLLMAVNLSAVQFKRGDLEKSVGAALAASGLEPALLELELTESVLIHDSDQVLATVRRLKALGLKLAIDDFGTGYSSLAYLKRFAVDKLKIDQSFIRDLGSDMEESAIVRAIIQMARSLNLTTIAEGVESEHTLQLLRSLQCDEVQGAQVAMPMSADDIAAYISRLN